MISKFKRIKRLLLIRRKGLWRAIVNSIFMVLDSPYAPCYPIHITIEPTAFCNLKCPICETGNRTLRRKQNNMSLDGFKAIIDKIHFHTNTILLYFMGEPFLNPSIYEMIQYARQKKIYTCTCTNGEYINAKKLIGSGINEVSFQVSGVTPDVHGEYRYGADLEKTMENLKSLIHEKKAHSKKDTNIEIGFIVMKHNEHQIEKFKQLGTKLGVDRIHIIKPRLRTIGQAYKFLPVNEKYWLYEKESYKKGILSPLLRKRFYNGCFWLWNSMVVTWNGDILPCCNDPRGNIVMGNIFKESLKGIWNSHKYRRFREAVLKRRSSLEPCSACVE